MKLFTNIFALIFILLSTSIGSASLNHSNNIKLSFDYLNYSENTLSKANDKIVFSLQNDLSTGTWEDDYLNVEENSNNSKDMFILLEVVSGAVGGVLLGVVGLFLGNSMFNCSRETNTMFCGLDETIIVGGIGLTLGTSLGVKLAGNLSNKKGSYASAFFGSIVGVALGVASIWAIEQSSDDVDSYFELGLVSMISLPAIVSTLMFNLYDDE